MILSEIVSDSDKNSSIYLSISDNRIFPIKLSFDCRIVNWITSITNRCGKLPYVQSYRWLQHISCAIRRMVICSSGNQVYKRTDYGVSKE